MIETNGDGGAQPITRHNGGQVEATSDPGPVPPWLGELLENAVDPITLTERGSGRLLAVSRSFCAWSGYSRDELAGASAADIGLSVGHPSEPGSDVAAAAGALRRCELRGRDGTQRSVEISTQAVSENRVLLTIIRDVTDRDRAERELTAREAQFHTAVDAALDAVAIIAPVHDAAGEIVDFRFAYVNRAYAHLVGHSYADLLGHRLGEVFPGFAAGPSFTLCRRVMLTGEPAHRADVAPGTRSDTTSPRSQVLDVTIAPTGYALVITACDVTERWVAQRAHATAELRFRDVIESAPDAMVIVDAQGDIVLVNAQTERLFGYAREELIGRSHELLVPEARRQRHRSLRARYMDHPRVRHMGSGLVLYGRRSDGSEFPVEISLSPLGPGGDPLVCSAIRDVSERVRIEDERNRATEELRHSRTRLAEAERIAGMGSWEGDLRTDTVAFSDGLLEIHGLAPGQFRGSGAAAREPIYPEDRERFGQAVREAVAARSSYTIEYRAIRADGRVRTLRGHGDVLVDETGVPSRIVGIVQDITDARRTQEALQSTSDELGRHAGELQQLALSAASEPAEIPQAPLTARQLEILQLIAHGLTNASIAERLVLTEGTIKWHVRQILAKTNSANRAEAIARVLGNPQ